jgi:hypothetical protein
MQGKDKKAAPGTETETEGQAMGAVDKDGDKMDEKDLEKSLGKLAEFASSGDSATRKQELLSKALDSGDLEKSEREELFGLLGGATTAGAGEPTHSEALAKSMTSNDSVQKALDVSDYLREQHGELVKSLGVLADYQEQSDSRQHEFNLVLAKAVSDTGQMVKAMSERLGVIASQPARGPKSKMAPGQVLQKSFGGETQPEGEQLDKSQVLDALDTMHVDSLSKGMDGRSAGGEDILRAIAKYENSNMLSKSMLVEVQSHRQKQATAH